MNIKHYIDTQYLMVEDYQKRFEHIVEYDTAKPLRYEDIDRTLLTEEYKSLLVEELSISNYVTQVVKGIMDLINKDVPNLQPIITFRTKTYILQNYSFIGYLPIEVNYVFCDDEESYKKANKSCHAGFAENFYIEKDNNIYRIYGVRLELNCPLLNGKIVEEKFYGVVFHEIEHIYQEYQKLLSLSEEGQYKNSDIIEKSFLNQTKGGKRRENLYSLAISNININKHPNEYVRWVSWIFYLSTWKEQDAFVNQLYGHMMKLKDLNISNFDEKYKQTDTFRIYNFLNNIENNIENWGQGDVNDQKEYSNMTIYFKQNGIQFSKNDTIMFAKKIAKRLGIKINKVLKKVKIDKKFIRPDKIIMY